MDCFVTGATGFLGSHVAQALVDRGDVVTGLTSTPANTPRVEAAGITPVVGDIRTPDPWLDTALGTDVVINTAQLPLPRRPTKRYVARTIEAQTAFLAQLLPRLDSTTAFVYTSGTGIYGDGESVCDESYPTAPFLRSRRDLVAERLILDAVDDYGVKATILRPAPIYGPGGLWHRFWGRKLAAGKRAAYAGRGDQTWSFVSIWDCVQAYLAVIDNPTIGEIYNVTDDEPVTIETFLAAFAETMDAPRPIGIPSPVFRVLAGPVFTQPMVSSFAASNQKIRRERGFEPEYPNYREGAIAVANAYTGGTPTMDDA